MSSYESKLHYNSYEQCSSYHETLNEQIVPPSVNWGTPSTQNIIGVAPDCAAHVPPAAMKRRQNEAKKVVDTSAFSVEERLVAAVWVHERKLTKTSMSQIKYNFLQRFRREPPAKNTLLVWERKLFSSGSVHDAPRPGRPTNRGNKVEEVSASLRATPALSVRARAAALRLPRSTLRAILRRDLPHPTHQGNRTAKKAGKKLRAAAARPP